MKRQKYNKEDYTLFVGVFEPVLDVLAQFLLQLADSRFPVGGKDVSLRIDDARISGCNAKRSFENSFRQITDNYSLFPIK